MKKKISLLTVLCIVCCLHTGYAFENMNVLSDGGVSIKGNTGKNIAGTNVTVEVLNSKSKRFDEEKWQTDPVGGLEYIEVVETEENGDYQVDFYLDKSGKYDCIISYEGNTEEFVLTYTNKTENKNAVDEMKSAENASKIFEILQREDTATKLMLSDSEIYMMLLSDTTEKDGTLPLEKVAEIIFDSRDEMKGDESEEYAENLQKGMLAVALNGGTAEGIADIQPYYSILGTEELGLDKYYMKEKSKYITELMSEENIENIGGFNEALLNSVILTNVKYSDSIDNTSQMLKEFSDEIGISSAKITTACVRDILGSEFKSTEEIKKFIKDYGSNDKPSSSGGGGGGGSRGGVSGVSVSDKQFSQEYENPPGTTEGVMPFEDIDGVEWAKDAINSLYVKGIISGKSESQFAPDDYVTREEFVKMLVTALSFDIIGSGMEFEDVVETDWYYEYVRSAYYAEIVTGISDTKFGAGMNITRQDIAVMGCRALDAAGIVMPEKSAEIKFADGEDISDYARDAVLGMQRAGILNGDDTGRFNPTAFATRAEAAKIINGIYQLL